MSDTLIGMFNTMQDTLARDRIAGNAPDILIEMSTTICEAHDCRRTNELIPAGQYWVQKALEEQ